MRLVGPQDTVLTETCSGRINETLREDGAYRIDVSDCIPGQKSSAGNYTLTLSSVSSTLAGEPNCGPRVACAPGIYTGSLQDPTQPNLSGAVGGHTFALSTPGTVSIAALDPSGAGVVELRLYDPNGQMLGDTCTGGLNVSVGVGVHTILVNDCSGSDVQSYSLSFRVVSDGPDNCGVPLPCGTTPVVHRIGIPGETGDYSFVGQAGDRVSVDTTDITGSLSKLGLQIFDPLGHAISGATSCTPSAHNLTLARSGKYTALVSACGLPTTGLYGIEYEGPSCPTGPDITYFGLARADSAPVPVADYDAAGRPIYSLIASSGFSVVIEAQPGPSHASVGPNGYNYDAADPSVLPDMQVILSRPLGNGSLAVCDKTPPNAGGVPRTSPFQFAQTSAVAAAVNDFGCRVNDGTGQPLGVSNFNACTMFPDGEFHFVNPASTLQFCTPIDTAATFPPGDTIIKARVRDTQGSIGPEREIVVRLPDVYCAGDCNGDDIVTVDEIIDGLNIALGEAPLDDCDAMDANHDLVVTVDEILTALNMALNGCPASAGT